MQVNNNVQSPNFGMALKISKGAKDALKELPMETIKKLQKAGEELKDTKFYHVKVNDDLGAKITADKDAYFGLFPRQTNGFAALKNGVPADNIIMIEDNVGTVAGVARYVPYGETQPFFNTWGAVGPYNKVEDVSHLSKIAKVLDNVAIERYKASKAALEDAKKAAVSKAVDNLIDTFGE